MEYEHGDAKVKSQQAQMFAQAQAGDTIIVLEVSRLARSTQQLCETKMEPIFLPLGVQLELAIYA